MEETVGVVIGRFQVPRLHEGHRHLLSLVEARHKDVLIMVGTTEAFPTPRNPLSFEMRARMLAELFPHATIFPLPDHPSDDEWVKAVDSLIASSFPSRDAVLYGSRDSCIKEYSGRHRRHFVAQVASPRGTDERIGAAVRHSEDFRRGFIYAQTGRFPIVYPTVDIAVLNTETRSVLLGAKSYEYPLLRFIGGFVDVSDASWEKAALRELAEETTLTEVRDLVYVGSATINDWRYRHTGDGIKTSFFCVRYVSGTPSPRDDIARLAWVPYAELRASLAPGHQPLGELLLSHIASCDAAR
ncbi:MAG: NUDIX domain-containing protein [Candidatus Liptonbacteria bacterium]|nr:NUDIX domain-containing protein [Candidatus Liptonbacteria bacterium]